MQRSKGGISLSLSLLEAKSPCRTPESTPRVLATVITSAFLSVDARPWLTEAAAQSARQFSFRTNIRNFDFLVDE